MNNSNNEAKRLVYAEGLNLETALELSKTYKNVVFLTNDNKTSGDDISEYDSRYIDNESWKLGVNIVKNGLQYIPIAGIHPLYNSFKSDGFIYKINVQEGTNLLCLSKEEIYTRGIYVGYNSNDNYELIDEILSDNISTGNASRYDLFTLQSDESDPDRNVYLYLIKNGTINTVYDGYLLVYNNISALYEASRPLSLLNYNVSYLDENSPVYCLTGDGTIDVIPGQYVTGSESSQAVWTAPAGQYIDIIIPEEHKNNVLITNTLTNNENGHYDESTNTLYITNNNLAQSFVYDRTEKGTLEFNTIPYVKFNLDIQENNNVEITGLAVKIQNN